MKKIILSLSLLMCVFYTHAQVESLPVLSKYFESYTLDYTSDEYQSNEDGQWIDIYFTPYTDYILIEIDAEGFEKEKLWWEYLPESSDDISDSYRTEDGELIVFDYEDQVLLWYYDYNEKFDRYESLDIVSKIEILE